MRSTLYKILVFHILILLFQLAFRQLILDTTFVRDIGIFLMCFVYFVSGGKISSKNDSIGTMVKIYLWYGVIMTIIHIVDGVDALGAIVTYRNHFFPFILFFMTVYIMYDIKYRIKWVNVLFVVFLIILFGVYLEALMDIIGISRGTLPWYQYQFTHYYRFTEDATGERLITNPEQSPILGFLGWNNPTSCAIAALFSFFIPFLLQPSSHEQNIPIVSRISNLKKIAMFVLTIGAMAILTIKTSFACLAVVFILYVLQNGRKGLKMIVPAVVFLIIVAVLTFPLWGESFTELVEETRGEYGFSYIFNQNVVLTLLQAAYSDSPLALLFGVDLSNNSMYELLEIRVIVHTIQFGLFWLIIYGMIMLYVIRDYKYIRRKKLQPFDKTIAMGAFLMVVCYLVDFLHYAHAMFYFHFDIMVVSIAILVAVKQKGVCYED